MNPHDWGYPVKRLQTHLRPDHQRVVSSRMDPRVPMVTGDWETHPMDAAAQPLSRGLGWRQPSPPPQNFPHPDGDPLNSEAEDPELARKKRELLKLHEQIQQKKATIAFKAIELVKSPSEADDPDELDPCNPETLRGRVTEILQQRSFSFFSKVKLSKLRARSAIMKKDEVKQQHHPLKLRVRMLRAHRLMDPCVLPSHKEEVPEVPPRPTTRSVTSPVKEESRAAKGFERFINVLNRGADINLKNLVPAVSPPPPDHSVTSLEKQQESHNNKGYERLLSALKKAAAAAPYLNQKVPAVPMLPSDHSITSPKKQESPSNKGYERLLSVLNKGAAPNLNTKVPDVSPPPPDHSITSPAKLNKGGAAPNLKDTVPVDHLQPLDRSITTPAKEESAANKGYERFLSLLNKGAAIDLKTMVFDVSLDPPNQSDPPGVKKEGSASKGSRDKNVVDRASEEKSSSKNKAERCSNSAKSVITGSDHESTPSRGSEGKSNVSKVAERESSADGGPETSMRRRHEGKSRVSERESRASRLPELENTVGRSPEHETSVNKGAEPDSSVDRGSQCENKRVRTKPDSSVSDNLTSESSANKGFDRFLSLLNSGVDINKLSKMVNNDEKCRPKTPPRLKREPKSESQKSNSRSPAPGSSGVSGVRSTTNSANQEPSLPEGEELKKAKRKCSLDSSSQSEPLLEEKKKEETETLKVEEKQKELQNILKTLGLNLEVDELRKITDRTLERLYGKKEEGRQTSESRKEQESQPKRSRGKRSRSRSSSSSSSSPSSSSSSSCSRSRSRSRSRSPSRHRWRSRSRDAHRRSRDRGRDGVRRQSRAETRKEQGSSYRNAQQAFPSPYPSSSSYADYSLYQYAQYINYYNAYTGAVNASWPFAPNQSHMPLSSLNPQSIQPEQLSFQDLCSSVNPDLSMSEGRGWDQSTFSCLKVIDTKPSSKSRHELDTKQRTSKKEQKTRKSKTPERTKGSSQRKTEKRPSSSKPTETSAPETKASVNVAMETKVAETAATEKTPPFSNNLNSRPSNAVKFDEKAMAKQNKKRLEEEIKANLREKLLEFNRKARLITQAPSATMRQPADSLDSELI